MSQCKLKKFIPYRRGITIQNVSCLLHQRLQMLQIRFTMLHPS